jgi:hypothetical protein
MSLPKLPASAGADAIQEAFDKEGGVIIQGLFTQDQLKRLNADLDPYLETKVPGRPAEVINYSDDTDFYGAHTKRYSRVVETSETFRQDILEIDLFHELCERSLTNLVGRPGTGYSLTAAQAISIGPGNQAQPLHRDQELLDLWDNFSPSTPLALVNFLVALGPFTDENGATRIVPGSHLWPVYESSMSEKSSGAKYETVPVEMEPGDAFYFSGKVIHGGGANRTHNQWRRGMSISFSRMGLLSEQAWALILSRDIVEKMSYRGQAMVGFRSLWPPTGGPVGTLWYDDYVEIGKAIGLSDKPLYPERTANGKISLQ